MVNILGCRVIRGKDWMWGDEDGGLGYSGTVVGLGRSGNERSCAGTVEVCWDCGLRSNYRVGLHGKYDLNVIDTAQCGVIHVSVNCDFCNQNGIRGLRFKCTICYDYDLCTRCYHDGRHNLEHSFLRFDNVAGVVPGIKLTPRSRGDKIQVKGIFEGATVVKRSWDWLWDFEHGGVFETSMDLLRNISVQNCHSLVTCDFCLHSPIFGPRYQCTVCDDYDLCSDCYHNGEHHLQHRFRRFKYDVRRFPEHRVKLTAREQRGIHWKWTFSIENDETDKYCDSCKESYIGPSFKCAKSVVQYIICQECYHIERSSTEHLFVSFDDAEARISGLYFLKENEWKWTNTPICQGAHGIVEDIFDAGKTGRSLAFVEWTDRTTNDYRIGDAGRVDLKFVNPASGGTYYACHLPILAEDPASLHVREVSAPVVRRRIIMTAQNSQQKVAELMPALSKMDLNKNSSEASTSRDLGRKPIEDSSASRERLHELECKVRELEDQNTCPICMEASKGVVFQCGHSTCEGCSTELTKCHFCRIDITKKIKFY